MTLPRPHPGQEQIRQGQRRFNVMACGRRFGKTIYLETLCVEPALRGYPVGWFSPTYKLLLEVWRDMQRMLRPIIRRVSSQDHRLELVTGGVIEFWSLENPDAGRSRKYRRVVVDEAGLVRDLQGAWDQAIRPTLADYEGDGFFGGTPKGRNGFYDLYQRGLDPLRDEWACWQLPTSANPYIKAGEIEAARRELPERVFAQEYLAEFLDDGGGVFRRVREAIGTERHEQAIDGHQYVMGADWGKHNDFTVLYVIDVTTRALVAGDRFNQIDYRLQRGRLRSLWERFNCPPIIAESNSMGDPIIEELRREGVPVQPFQTTNATKAAIIEGLALALERGELALMDDPILIGELLTYEAERLPSGLLRYTAPPNKHDDCVMALALAWYGADRPAAMDLVAFI